MVGEFGEQLIGPFLINFEHTMGTFLSKRMTRQTLNGGQGHGGGQPQSRRAGQYRAGLDKLRHGRFGTIRIGFNVKLLSREEGKIGSRS